MRIDPSEKVIRAEEIAAATQAKINKVARVVAIVVAFLSTYSLIIKILFF